ncbi:MAG: hypothetical protein M9894_15825 [Planctomycetes bacterium]|nr:hypothetical protein [Planctomycetota bacterium]
MALLVGALGLGGQALVRPRLEARQVEAGVVVAAEGQAGMSADLAVPVLALGAFRGLVVDYLWLRSSTFREQGRHFEARQVAEQLCRLQPRLPDVWVYLGHDLAYNVAGAVEEPEARWRWIQNGIELLRDQGLRHNPGDPDLCFMLARTLQDKIGTTTDDHHMRYKAWHAEQMVRAMGDTPLAVLAEAPGLAALAAGDRGARALLARAAALGLETPEALAAADAPELAVDPAWPRVQASARAEALRERLRLDPARMLRLDAAYGPLDWRGVDAVTVYWASVGLEGAERRRRHRDAYAARRTIHAALKNAVRRGRVERLEGAVFLAPLPALVPRVDALLREGIEDAERAVRALEPLAHRGGLSPDDEERLDAAVVFLRNQRSAREGFLGEAIIILAENGLEEEARRLHARARRDFPGTDFERQGYDEFVLGVLARRFVDAGIYDSQQGMTQLLEGTWVSAYTQLALGEDARYRGLEALARASQRRWDAYLASLEEPDAVARLGVRYEEVRRRALRVAAERLPPLLQERLAARAGLTREEVLRPDRAPAAEPLPGRRP